MTRNTGLPLAEDILEGAEAIAEEVFGNRTPKARRRVYDAAERGEIPVWRIGQLIFARRSTLRAHIENLERAALGRGKVTA